GLVELRSVNDFGEPVLMGPGFSSRVGEESGPEAARPTREFRPELERPGHETSTSHRLELADIESRSGEYAGRDDLSSFAEREESRPGASSETEPTRTEPTETTSGKPE